MQQKNITVGDNKNRMNIANFINIYVYIYIYIYIFIANIYSYVICDKNHSK